MVRSCALCSLRVFRERVVAVARIAAHGVLQQRHRLRRPVVRFAAHPVGVFAADLERSAQDRRVAEGVRVPPNRLLGDLLQARALDHGRGAEEELVDERAWRGRSASKICAPQ